MLDERGFSLMEALTAASKDFMAISLVPYVPDELVFRGVECIV